MYHGMYNDERYVERTVHDASAGNDTVASVLKHARVLVQGKVGHSKN